VRVICGPGAQSSLGGFGKGEYHYNWTDATYEGQVSYDQLADDDNDINLVMSRWDNAGATKYDQRGLQVEFDANETVAHFTTPWWKGFWQAAQAERLTRDFFGSQKIAQDARKAAQALFTRRDGSPIEGIVTAILELDCVHSCGSELHPVFAVALHVKDDPIDDEWAIFTRNYGNEGYCSPDAALYRGYQFNTVAITLPWRKVSANFSNFYTNAQITNIQSAVWSAANKPVIVRTQVNPSSGIVFQVVYDDPPMTKPQPLFGYLLGEYWAEFEVHLKWSGSVAVQTLSKAQQSQLISSQIPSPARIGLSADESREEFGEPEKSDLHLPAADLKALRAKLEATTPVKTVAATVESVAPGKSLGRPVTRFRLQPAKTTAPQVQIGNDVAKQKVREQALAVVMKAHPELAH
jgi:hypothetical protein